MNKRKDYVIIKSQSFYAVANKEQIKEYYHCHFLPIVLSTKRKNTLIYIIENNKHYEFLKNNTDYKTIYIY